jgi:DNA-directed RNA polymerase omega subunit
MLPNPDVLNEFKLGKFVLSNLAAKRAKQLKEGAMPLVHIESRHPLTIALAEIAAGKIEPRMMSGIQGPVGESLESTILTDDVIAGEFGMLLPALDENEAILIEAIGLEDAEPDPEDVVVTDGEMSLSDLGDETEEEEAVEPAEDDTLSLSDIAEEEEALEDGTDAE